MGIYKASEPKLSLEPLLSLEYWSMHKCGVLWKPNDDAFLFYKVKMLFKVFFSSVAPKISFLIHSCIRFNISFKFITKRFSDVNFKLVKLERKFTFPKYLLFLFRFG